MYYNCISLADFVVVSSIHSNFVNICCQTVIIIVTDEAFLCLHHFQVLSNPISSISFIVPTQRFTWGQLYLQKYEILKTACHSYIHTLFLGYPVRPLWLPIASLSYATDQLVVHDEVYYNTKARRYFGPLSVLPPSRGR